MCAAVHMLDLEQARADLDLPILAKPHSLHTTSPHLPHAFEVVVFLTRCHF